jgi:hypothetical protein
MSVEVGLIFHRAGFKFDLIWVDVRDCLGLADEDAELCRNIFAKLEAALTTEVRVLRFRHTAL